MNYDSSTFIAMRITSSHNSWVTTSLIADDGDYYKCGNKNRLGRNSAFSDN